MSLLNQFRLVPTNATFVLPGEFYGRLEIIEVGQIDGTYRYMSICRCSCDDRIICVRSDHLVAGKTLSCGCLSGHYWRWWHMMDRCYNPDCAAWNDYGGRGIKVCADWHDITTFVEGLPPGYQDGLEMDRIDNDGNYEPGNIRWATRQVNTTNRRSARLLSLNGQTKSLSDWADELKVHPSVILTRMNDLGWTLERALTEPPAEKVENMRYAQSLRWAGHVKRLRPEPRVERTFELDGVHLTISGLSDLTGIPKSKLRKRLCERDWPVLKAIQDRSK